MKNGIIMGVLAVAAMAGAAERRNLQAEIDAVAQKGVVVVRDCQQINRTNEKPEFFRNNGMIGELVQENVRLVAAPGENVLRSDEKIPGIPPR